MNYLVTQFVKPTIAPLLFVILFAAVFILNDRLVDHFDDFIKNLSFEPLNSIFFINSHLTIPQTFITLISLFLSAAFLFLKKHDLSFERKLLYWITVIFCFFPIIPIFSNENFEIKWRLMILSFLLSILIFLSLAPLAKKWIQFTYYILLIIIFSFDLFTYTGFPWVGVTKTDLPNINKLSDIVKTDEVLITHHGMEFMIDYFTSIRARSLIDPNRKPDYQLAYLPEFYFLNEDVADELNQLTLEQIGPNYFLFNYSDFTDLIKKYSILANTRNVFKIRPDFVQNYPSPDPSLTR